MYMYIHVVFIYVKTFGARFFIAVFAVLPVTWLKIVLCLLIVIGCLADCVLLFLSLNQAVSRRGIHTRVHLCILLY